MSDDCYFCREPADVALDDHHIVPKRLVGNDADQDREIVGETVVLCSNCHRKFHSILDPALEYVGERLRQRIDELPESDFIPAAEL